MDIDKLVNSFNKNKRAIGWISPSNELIFDVYDFNHFKLLETDPEFKYLIELLRNFEQLYDDDYHYFDEQTRDLDHPAWHTFYSEYSNLKDLARSLIMAKAYSLGWVRFHFVKRHTCSVEGFQKYLNHHYKNFNDLQLLLEIDILREPVDNYWSSSTSDLRVIFYYLNDEQPDRNKTSKQFIKGKTETINTLKLHGLYDICLDLFNSNIGKKINSTMLQVFWKKSK